MSTATLVRAGCGALIAAALFVTAAVIYWVAPVPSPYVSTTDYVHQAVLVLAFLGAAAAAVAIALLLRSIGRFAALSLVGAVLAGGGYVVVGLLGLVNLARGERVLFAGRPVVAVVLLVGSALLGVLVLITRALPWWCGVLLIVAFPLGDVVDALLPGGEGVLLALLWGTVGFALLNRAHSAESSLGAAARPEQVLR
jgi:hypothetical protein